MKWSDSGGGSFEQPSVGTHVARCVRVIDIGTQTNDYQGKTNTKRQCIIAWELPTEIMQSGEKAGQPFLVGKFYTSSLNEKANLRHDLANWRGRDFTPEELKGFNPKNILDRACLLSLTENDKGRAGITGVMALPKGAQVPARVNEIVYFSLDEFDAAIFDSLSDGYKNLIMKSPEYQALSKQKAAAPRAGGAAFDDMDDDINF